MKNKRFEQAEIELSNDDFQKVWVGDLIEQDDTGYVFRVFKRIEMTNTVLCRRIGVVELTIPTALNITYI